MTLLTLGEATTLAFGRLASRRPPGRGALPRPDGRVHRASVEAGTFENRFFATPAKGETDRMLRAARAALDAGRRLKRAARAEASDLTAPERALAALTAGTIRVFEEICTLARLNGGRVFPSYDHLTRATALGRATVARAIASLEAAGFLVRQRRFRRVAAEGPGPRYRQTSNVYRPTLPERLTALLPRWVRPAPLPADVVQHLERHDREQAMMRADAPAISTAAMTGALGRALASFGAAIDAAERESHDDPGTLLKSFNRSVRKENRPGNHRTRPGP